MPRIVLYISLVLLVACQPIVTQYESGHVSIEQLRSRARELSQVIEADVYVEGYVVANDKFNELDYAIVIDDGTAGIELAIDSRAVNSLIPLFSRVRLSCAGLSIGREGARVVVGAQPTSEYVVDRIAESTLFNYITSIDGGDSEPVPRCVTISEIGGADVLSYVSVVGLRVVDQDRGERWCDCSDASESQFTTTLRRFTDGCDTISIITSGDCRYASELIPDYQFTATGVVDWSDGDYALRLTSRQITPEDL
jgi:hypothetical protein